MGDADSQIPEQRGLDALQMTRVLDMLDEDISHLHQTVHDLEERTLRAISAQIKGYEDFRLFFLSLNLAFLPLLLAAGICYGMRDLITSEAAKMALQSFVMFLIFISGTIGIPMYLGAVWAMYSFSLPKGAYVENFVRTLEEYREANESVPNSEIRPLDSSASIGLESESESQEHFMIES